MFSVEAMPPSRESSAQSMRFSGRTPADQIIKKPQAKNHRRSNADKSILTQEVRALREEVHNQGESLSQKVDTLIDIARSIIQRKNNDGA